MPDLLRNCAASCEGQGSHTDSILLLICTQTTDDPSIFSSHQWFPTQARSLSEVTRKVRPQRSEGRERKNPEQEESVEKVELGLSCSRSSSPLLRLTRFQRANFSQMSRKRSRRMKASQRSSCSSLDLCLIFTSCL